jgi:hypothetical protein
LADARGDRRSQPEAGLDAAGPRRARTDPVLDASPNAIVAIAADGRIVYANPRVETTFGYSPRELIGEPIETLLPDRVSERHVGHRRAFFAQPTARPMGIGLDLAGRRRDGSEFPVEISLTPVALPDGLIAYATVVDITARKAAEEAVARSERQLRAVLDASPNSIVAIAGDGRITYANPRVETTFGYPPDELIGQPIETLLPDRVSERHVGHRRAFFAQPTARPMGIGLDLAGRRRDGSEFPVEISLTPVALPDGVVVYASVVDITARKGLEDQLLQAQKMESIGRLAGGIAHDFNNMLSAISGYSDLLLADVANPAPIDRDEIRECAQAVHDAAARAATLTSQLLAFSRQQIVQPRVIDLAEGVAGLEPMLARLIGERVRLDLRLDHDTGRIRIDPGQLDQIVVNLVVNARDAIPAGGTITVETSRTTLSEPYAAEHFEVIPGPYAMLAVSDNGMGMDVETRKHIFEPFYTTKERGRGTGLGLATIYGIVRQSGGHIWLYSEPGIGSTFKLFFPRAEADVDRDEPAPATPDLGTGTILLVEDEDAVRDIVRRILERAGYRVVAAPDAPAALEIVRGRGEQIAALVSDVVMPGLMGTELADFVRRERPEIGIVLLSGYTAETLDLADLLARGARFLSKPFAPDALIREVAEAIAAATRSSSRES